MDDRDRPPGWWKYVDPLAEPIKRERVKSTRKRWWGWGIAVLVVGCVVASGIARKNRTVTITKTPPSVFVPPAVPVATVPTASPAAAISKCSPTQLPGIVEAVGTVTNHGASPHTYSLHVEFLDRSAVRIAEGWASQSDVAPGETAQWSAVGAPPPGSTMSTCRLLSVQ
jgi:hypothetical protein